MLELGLKLGLFDSNVHDIYTMVNGKTGVCNPQESGPWLCRLGGSTR